MTLLPGDTNHIYLSIIQAIFVHIKVNQFNFNAAHYIQTYSYHKYIKLIIISLDLPPWRTF